MTRIFIIFSLSFMYSFIAFSQTSVTPEEAKKIKAWMLNHEDYRFIALTVFENMSERDQKFYRSSDKVIFYKRELRFADIELHEAGHPLPYLLLTQSEFKEWEQTDNWISDHKREVHVCSKTEFEAYTESKKTSILASPHIIYTGRFLTFKEIEEYKANQ